MGIFSKIFGNSDDPAAPGGEATQREPAKTDERDTSPPTRAPSRPEQFAKAGTPETQATEARAEPAKPAKPPPRRADAKAPRNAGTAQPELSSRMADVVRSQASAVQSPRPSVPPRVEATLLSPRPEASPKSSAKHGETGKREASKRGPAANKAVASTPIRPVGVRSIGAPSPQAAAPDRPPQPAPGPAQTPSNSVFQAEARAAAPQSPEPVRSEGSTSRGDASPKAVQAEPLELDPLGGSVAPPRNPALSHDDVDHAFARMVAPSATGAAAASFALDEQVKKANIDLFHAMVATHADPVKDFLLELAVGPASKQWLDIARPAVESIRRAATELGQTDLVAALSAFEEALAAAARAIGMRVEGGEREALIRAHAALSAALPEAFDLVKERDLREPLVVRHLLLQVPGIHKVTIDKLYAAGLASLDALCRSSVDDLVQVGRLDRDGADAISSRFRQYWSERAAQPVHKTEERARRKLATLLEQLGIAHQAFQRAEAEENREKKREARNARRKSALAINVLLAQLGEVELVQELERSPTERKIERVRSYVDRMARARMPQQKEAS